MKPSAQHLKWMGKQPFGPWETRVVPLDDPRRPELAPNKVWLQSCFLNNRYSVQVSLVGTSIGEVIHLWIRRHDGQVARSWADLQRIKDELAGTARVAVEVFPPANELVDQANMFHLWVMPEGHLLPFGLHR